MVGPIRRIARSSPVRAFNPMLDRKILDRKKAAAKRPQKPKPQEPGKGNRLDLEA